MVSIIVVVCTEMRFDKKLLPKSVELGRHALTRTLEGVDCGVIPRVCLSPQCLLYGGVRVGILCLVESCVSFFNMSADTSVHQYSTSFCPLLGYW